MIIGFNLNGRDFSLDVAPDRTLAEILRDEAGLTGTKVACGLGRCGACAVLVNGEPVNSCMLMAWQVAGCAIVTAEGLDAVEEGKIVRNAMIAENAFQCGYCAPGFTIVLTALIREGPEADEDTIRAALEGNLCRCTGYHSIIRGALSAVRELRACRAERVSP